MEGYDVECFDDHVSNDLYCIICLKLMRNAIQMRCGHGMCKNCFDGLVHSCELRNTELNCPSCRKSVVVDEIMNVPMIDRVITSLKVKCSNNKHGCQWVSKLETLENHFKKCEYAPVQCPNEMCIENVPRFQMEEHLLKSCSYATVECIYRDFGCTAKVMYNDMDTHIKSSPLKHLEMMSGNIQEKDKIIETLQRENYHLQNRLHEMRQQNLEMTEFKNQLSKANVELKDMISQFPEYQLSVKALNEELKATRAKFDELSIRQQASGAKHNKDAKEQEASVPVETVSSQHIIIDDKEVIDSLKFIVFRGELWKGESLTQLNILDQALQQFQLEYSDNNLQWESQMMIPLKGASDNIKAKIKFSNAYWEHFLYSLTDKFRIICNQHISQIGLLCKQLQYLQDNTIKPFLTNVTTICIGSFRYCRVKNINTNPDRVIILGNFNNHQVFINEKQRISVGSKAAKAVMICHERRLKTITANEVRVGIFVFESPLQELYQDAFIHRNKTILLKIQEK